MIKEKLMNDLKEAMKNKDLVRKNTIQMVRAAILQVEKDKQIELTETQIVEIIAKEAKKRKDTTQEFEKSGREDLIKQNNEEIAILTEYLPKQLEIGKVEKIVSEVINQVGATSMKDMGMVMKTAKERIGASADGKTISDVVKKLLTK